MASHRELHRIFWMVKGHIGDDETVLKSYNGYFKRLWGNHEVCYREEGFEEAFDSLFMERVRRVAKWAWSNQVSEV